MFAGTNQQEREDFYPSRGGQSARFLERIDPVVYAESGDKSPIDPVLVKQYEDNGFLVLDDIFSAAEVERMQAELDRLRHDPVIKSSDEVITEPESGDIRSIFRVHENSDLFSRLVSDQRLMGIAQYLLNDELYIHQSRLNYKPGFRGKEFYWHSDFETWHVEDGMPRMRALSMSITLTDNYEYNGPLMLIPGSHRQYAVCEGFTPAEHHKASLKKQEYGVPSDGCLQQMTEQGGIETATGKPGSVIIFDCNTMHGSNGNITPFPRSNVFFVYNALSNRVVEPFCEQPPRPEYICSRENIQQLQPGETSLV